MKITCVKTFLVHPETAKNLLFVKIETDAGLHGWGEAYTQHDRDRAIEVHIRQLGRYLVGRSPFNIKHFTFTAYTDFASKRGAMDLYSLNEDTLAEHPYRDFPDRNLRHPPDEGP